MTSESKATAQLDVKALEREHGELVRYDVDGQVFIFRPLTLDEFEDSQTKVQKCNGNVGPLNREIAQITLVYPPTIEPLQKAFQKRPALSGSIAASLIRVAGNDIEETVKKG